MSGPLAPRHRPPRTGTGDDGNDRPSGLDCSPGRWTGAVGGSLPAAHSGRTLVRPKARQSPDRRVEHALAVADPRVPANEAPNPRRPPGLRPRGDGSGRDGGAGVRRAARGPDPPGRAPRARDRPLVQRLGLLPDRLRPGPPHGPAPLPGPSGVLRRRRAVAHRARCERRLRDEPPQQHGLRPRRLPGGQPIRVELRRGPSGRESGPCRP